MTLNLTGTRSPFASEITMRRASEPMPLRWHFGDMYNWSIQI